MVYTQGMETDAAQTTASLAHAASRRRQIDLTGRGLMSDHYELLITDMTKESHTLVKTNHRTFEGAAAANPQFNMTGASIHAIDLNGKIAGIWHCNQQTGEWLIGKLPSDV